mmetsp:Transcript_27462/g.88666  ORF Transcript_27462/g.88666 Transcript_27462/m.88666 type:complete len:200 (+) Transcript_27462:729-1328(+)
MVHGEREAREPDSNLGSRAATARRRVQCLRLGACQNRQQAVPSVVRRACAQHLLLHVRVRPCDQLHLPVDLVARLLNPSELQAKCVALAMESVALAAGREEGHIRHSPARPVANPAVGFQHVPARQRRRPEPCVESGPILCGRVGLHRSLRRRLGLAAHRNLPGKRSGRPSFPAAFAAEWRRVRAVAVPDERVVRRLAV